MAIYSKFLELASGIARTVDLSTNTLSAGALQLNGSTSGTFTQNANATTTSYSIFWPAAQGGSTTYLENDGAGNLSWSAAVGGANTSLSNLITTSINQDLLPSSSLARSLGSSSLIWSAMWVKEILYPSEMDIRLDTQLIYNNTGSNVIDVGNDVLYDNSNNKSIDWANRELIDSSGSTIQLSWSTSGVEFNQLTASTVPYLSSGKVLTSSAVTPTELSYVSGVTSSIQTQLNGKQATGNYITALTGDVTASGPGSVAATLATVNSDVGTFGDASDIPVITVNGKGLITAVTTDTVVAPAGTLSGNTLNSTVLYSSLTALGAQSQALNMNSNKITSLANGSSASDAVNYSQLTSLSTGLVWQGGIDDPDLVDDSRTAPPGSPSYSLVYVISGVTTYTFTVTAANATTGDTYTDGSGNTYTVQSTIASGTTLVATSGNGFTPPSSGTLTKVSGLGDATITFASRSIGSTTASGAWAGYEGHAVWWDNSEWIDLSTGLSLGAGTPAKVQIGARFLVAASTFGGPALVDGTFAGGYEDSSFATVLSNSTGGFTYSVTAPVNNWATSDLFVGSQHYGNSFTYVTAAPYTFAVSSANATAGATYTSANGQTFTVTTTIVGAISLLVSGTGAPNASGILTKTSGTGDSTITYSSYAGSNWIDFAGPGKVIAGSALAYSGNTLNVLFDNSTIDINGSNQLEVKAGGITNTQVNGSAAIVYSKLSLSNSIVNSDINSSAAIAYSKLNLSNSIQLSDLTSNSVDENKIVSTAFSSTGAIAGGSGTKISVNVDNSTIDINGSDQLEVKSAGITSTQLASASVTASKLGSVTDGVTLDQSGAGSTLEIKTAGVGTTQLASASVTATKLGTVTDGVTTDQNGSGSTIEVLNAPAIKRILVAGQSFSANTSYAVRWGLTANGETAGQVYAADITTSSYDLFYVIGMASSSTSVSSGQNITVTTMGSFALSSSDSAFGSNTDGMPVFLSSSGAFSTTAPSSSGQAITRIGIIKVRSATPASNIIDVFPVPVSVN